MKLGLHTKLLISLLVLLLVVFALLGIVLLTDADNRISEFRETQARYQVKTLAEGSLDGLVSEDYEILERLVQSSMPSDEYAYAALVRPYGKVLTHTDLSLIGEQVTTISNTKEIVVRQIEYRGHPVKEVIYPAYVGEKIFANAHVAFYMDTETIFHQATILRIVAVLVVSLVLLIVASHFVTRTITVPIEKLKKSVNKVSLDAPVEIDSVIQNRSDEIGELARSFRDVSERLVESHSELYLSMKENAAIVETSLDGIIVVDQKGIVEMANSAVEQIFGYSKEEVVGENITTLMPMKYKDNHNDYIGKYLKTKKPKVVGSRSEFKGKRKDGSSVPIEVAVREIKLQGESKFVGNIRDITSRYENEQVLLLAKEAAEEGSRIKSEFLATISHELRTPLNGIIGSIELIKEDGGLQGDTAECLDLADRSAHNLLVILNNILDFSDMQADRIELYETAFNVRELFSSVVDVYMQSIKQKPITLSYTVDDRIPEYLIGDIQHIRGIVRNLLNNAIKFTEQGTISIGCHLLEDMSGEKVVRFEVVDTGVGVESQDQLRIFDLFTQVDGSYTRAYGGTGIGLSICKQLVTKMGGEIGVDSVPGEGSTFWFTLALTVADKENCVSVLSGKTKEKEAKQKTSPVEIINKKDKCFLVVEDDVSNQLIIGALISKLGYTAEIVDDGDKAVKAIQKRGYDMVLMDCQMPIMDGFAATKKIRAYEGKTRYTPIIAVTANAMKGDRDKCIAAGMDDYLAKPVSIEDLEKKIVEWLNRAPNDNASYS